LNYTRVCRNCSRGEVLSTHQHPIVIGFYLDEKTVIGNGFNVRYWRSDFLTGFGLFALPLVFLETPLIFQSKQA